MLFLLSSKSVLNFLFYFMMFYWGNTWIPVISQVKQSSLIVANCLKISNLFSEVRLDDAELTSILWRENCTLISAFCSSGARTKADVTKCGHNLESSSYALMIYELCRLHAPIRKYSISKLANNQEILCFQTAVLVEPSDQARNFFSLENPTPLREFGEKSDIHPPPRDIIFFNLIDQR